jgi:hypothetical protein
MSRVAAVTGDIAKAQEDGKAFSSPSAAAKPCHDNPAAATEGSAEISGISPVSSQFRHKNS